MTEYDKAYLAGFVDGEGYIGLSIQNTMSIDARVTVSNQHLPTLQKLTQLWGGKIYPANSRKVYTLRWGRKEVLIPLLEAIIPYMSVKRNSAEVLLKYCLHCKDQGQRNTPIKDELLGYVAEMELVKEDLERNIQNGFETPLLGVL